VTREDPAPTEQTQRTPSAPTGKPLRAGIVSFLPVRALIYGLDASDEIDLVRAPPSRQKRMLAGGELDAAFLPITDLPEFGEKLIVLTAGCVAAHGPTLVAKVFSQIRPEEVTVLWADSSSRSVVALVQVIWKSLYHRHISVIPFDPVNDRYPPDAQAVLLIGDKVVTEPPLGFDRNYDPTAMWYEMTGLPFVFGIWGTLRETQCERLHRVLTNARREGQKHLVETATEFAPAYGWPVDLAVRAMTRDLQFEFTDAHREGLEEFLEIAAEHKIIKFSRPLKYYAP